MQPGVRLHLVQHEVRHVGPGDGSAVEPGEVGECADVVPGGAVVLMFNCFRCSLKLVKGDLSELPETGSVDVRVSAARPVPQPSLSRSHRLLATAGGSHY